MNALVAIVSFSLGILCTLVGSFEFLNHANMWVIVSRDDLKAREIYIQRLEQEIHKHGWDERHRT